MAYATTYQHFGYPKVKIPNAGPPGTNNPEATSLQGFIAKYETQYLKFIFGEQFYQSYMAGIEAETPAYIAIRDGGTYTDQNNLLQKWEGFTAGSNPIANYIYWHYVDENKDTLFSIGVRKTKSENTDEALPVQKQVDAWNEMVRFNFKLHEYLYANRATFTTYIGLFYNVYRYNPYFIRDNQKLFIAQNIHGF